MYSKLLRSTGWAAALMGGVLLSSSVAHAQMGLNQGGSFIRQPSAPAPKAAPPPALPGAASRAGTPAPAEQLPGDMSPNAALFDAINRGDIAAARDALNRGAQLDAHNVLGLTPMELAVDLGRNDIAFLLLSMRGESGGSGGASPNAPAPAAAAKAAPAPTRPARVRTAAAKSTPQINPPAQPERAKLFAHDGGTPIPSLGFLGFDPQRATP